MSSGNHDLRISSIAIREWRRCLKWTLPIAALLTIGVLVFPKKYASEMEILVNNERQNPVVSTDATHYSRQAQEENEMQVNSEGELIQSWDILKDVVLETGMAQVDTSTPSQEDIEKAIKKLSRNLTVEPVKKSQMIRVTVLARTPEMANRVMRELESRYLQAHVQVYNSNGTYELFEQQANDYARDLSKSEVRLADFRKSYTLIESPDEQQLLAQRFTETRAACEDIDAEIAQLSKRIDAAGGAVKRIESRIVTQKRDMPDADLAQRLSSTLVDLKNRRTEMATKFRDDDRLVAQLDEEIANTQAMLDLANRQSHTEITTDVNPVEQATEKDSVADQIALAGLRARQAKVKQYLAQYQVELTRFASATVEHDALIRKVKENEGNYLLYAQKREQARIEDVLDRRHVANVAIAEQPTLTFQPAIPVLIIVLPLVWIVAGCIGVGVVCVKEYRKAQKVSVREPISDPSVALAS